MAHSALIQSNLEASAYWLLKSEPETYSFSQLLSDGRTNWDQVRNFQARNNIRKMQPGDLALIYHSGDEKAVVGVARITTPPYAEIDAEDGKEWAQVDVEPVLGFSSGVSLKEIKADPNLAQLPLIKQSRLSVMPITPTEFKLLLEHAGVTL
jgi:predicted RNA-binding protein with PUA-like domain